MLSMASRIVTYDSHTPPTQTGKKESSWFTKETEV